MTNMHTSVKAIFPATFSHISTTPPLLRPLFLKPFPLYFYLNMPMTNNHTSIKTTFSETVPFKFACTDYPDLTFRVVLKFHCTMLCREWSTDRSTFSARVRFFTLALCREWSTDRPTVSARVWLFSFTMALTSILTLCREWSTDRPTVSPWLWLPSSPCVGIGPQTDPQFHHGSDFHPHPV